MGELAGLDAGHDEAQGDAERSVRRLSVPLPVWHESRASARTDVMVALGEEGGFIATDRPLEPGTAVFLELSLGTASNAARAEIDAVVTRGTIDVDLPGFMVRFLDLDDAVRTWIAHHLLRAEPPRALASEPAPAPLALGEDLSPAPASALAPGVAPAATPRPETEEAAPKARAPSPEPALRAPPAAPMAVELGGGEPAPPLPPAPSLPKEPLQRPEAELALPAKEPPPVAVAGGLDAEAEVPVAPRVQMPEPAGEPAAQAPRPRETLPFGVALNEVEQALQSALEAPMALAPGEEGEALEPATAQGPLLEPEEPAAPAPRTPTLRFGAAEPGSAPIPTPAPAPVAPGPVPAVPQPAVEAAASPPRRSHPAQTPLSSLLAPSPAEVAPAPRSQGGALGKVTEDGVVEVSSPSQILRADEILKQARARPVELPVQHIAGGQRTVEVAPQAFGEPDDDLNPFAELGVEREGPGFALGARPEARSDAAAWQVKEPPSAPGPAGPDAQTVEVEVSLEPVGEDTEDLPVVVGISSLEGEALPQPAPAPDTSLLDEWFVPSKKP